jgi:tryptophan synthase alpha chain
MTAALPTKTTNRLDSSFLGLRSRSEGALVAFVSAGDPFGTVAETANVVLTLADAGADVIELGIPYSDPLADGPSVQAASQRALEKGVTPDFVFDVVRAVREKSNVPLVLMTYYNPVLIYGLSRFAQTMQSAGADGIIITDLPPEEAAPWKTAADEEGLATIFLLAPTSTPSRIAAVTRQMHSGFVYCVSRTGVTGAQQTLSPELDKLIGSIRLKTDLPLCIGFGISTQDQVRAVVSYSDGAVIGSCLVDFLHQNRLSDSWAEDVNKIVASWKAATLRKL